MKVLIVDDSNIMRKVLINNLMLMNFAETDILQAGDGKEAVQMASEQNLSLILMDWNMPNMLGIDAVRAIRANGNKTPIIMVTTEGERSNIVSAIQAGANNYLVKPFTSTDLQDKVFQLVPESMR